MPPLHSSANTTPIKSILAATLREIAQDLTSDRQEPLKMKQNVWEFLRRPDGTYTVSHNGILPSDSISEESLNREICVRYGFCGREFDDIRRKLERSGQC